ncbi:hypothetical protein JQ604_11575 [Bradyrhizobium jicamae]|uniref:hypothetical protein n=1 Tax=Bradyrhizobium jicamae TaxID=280332 RepID=UPI001BA938FE|nr:hypothetical protein [Bradyrhizobium jicamae]MBR0752825.1 hypothetical protein [Bradyrhizobium jicamae]
MKKDIRELKLDRLDQVNGGLKWTPVKNDDVIDARGGQLKLFGWTFSFGGDGRLSYVEF